VIREAKFDAQCASCGGKIHEGERLDYCPPTGDRPALTTHVGECPERKVKLPRGVNHPQRRDPEELIVWRTCAGPCGAEWAVPRDSLASRREPFVCTPCVEDAERRRGHLKVAA
jgi:hypothetical protein